MLRTGLVALQVALGAACGYLAWSLLAALVGARPVPEVAPPGPPSGSAPQTDAEHYSIIARRNLFRSELMGAPPGGDGPAEEQIAESQLKVLLLGTAATDPPEYGIATLEDLGTRERLQVHPGDFVQGARVVRVERTRLVVDNKGRLEEIVFDEEASGAAATSPAAFRPTTAIQRSPAPGAADTRTRAERIAERVRSLTEKLASAPPGTRAPMMAPSAPVDPERTLLRQAQIRPRWEGSQLAGLEVRNVTLDGELARAGIADGDVIRAVNGIEITELAQGYELLRTAAAQESLTLEIEREGQRRTLPFAWQGNP